jgi:phosphatidylinositol alpha-1,6-mannosyltransferase
MSRRHLLVTNDFPPKIGGIQNYLWELWRRLPTDATSVYTTPYRGTAAFDAQQPFAIERSPEPWLIPYPWLPARIREMARRTNSELVLFDPAIPVGAIGPSLGIPYGVILHGAEVTIPGRLPLLRQVLGRTLRSASLVVSAGQYALDEAERCAGRSLPSVVIPPGVDGQRFAPIDPQQRFDVRARYGVTDQDVLVATVSRLVPRKGMETLIRAAAEVDRRLGHANRSVNSGSADAAAPGQETSGPRLKVVIGGTGRQAGELADLVRDLDAPVQLAGRLPDAEVASLYGAADMMAMLCNERWFGLEQEGFGIVFLEAAAAGVPQVAGRSGGAHEAVSHGETGLIVDDPNDVVAVADALETLATTPEMRLGMGDAARRRALARFDYDRLAEELQAAIDGCELR